jgi:hypothetical protein
MHVIGGASEDMGLALQVRHDAAHVREDLLANGGRQQRGAFLRAENNMNEEIRVGMSHVSPLTGLSVHHRPVSHGLRRGLLL